MILIALALLLAAVRGEGAKTPKPQPEQSTSSETKPYGGGEISGPPKPALMQPRPTATTTPCSNHTENYYYPTETLWNWPGIIEALSTLGLLVFAGWQMCFLRQSIKAMEAATTAAREAADTAERALILAERAWVAFEVVGIEGLEQVRTGIERRSLFNPETVDVITIAVSYRFNNCGKTPARLIVGDVQFKNANPASLPSIPVYSPRVEMPELLIPPGPSAINSKRVELYPPQFKQFIEGNEKLIIFGYVNYRDVVSDPRKEPIIHKTHFRMECRFPGYINTPDGKVAYLGPWFFEYDGPVAYNQFT